MIRSALAWLVSKVPAGILTDRRFFELYQRSGWHATPVHFYQPIPDTRELPPKFGEKRSDLVGIDCNLEAQIGFLREVERSYLAEYHAIPNGPPSADHECGRSSGFGGIDGAILYSMIRKYTPSKLVEIGSGNSTLLSALALRRNGDDSPGLQGQLIAIDPYPKDYLVDNVRGLTRLIEEKVENVPISEFTNLGPNDILFIDSSHVVRICGDVVHEILEIVPRLQTGVLVHFHDIFLPHEYPREWVVDGHRFWSEQYLVQAFLAFNDRFEILWSSGCMHAYHPEILQTCFPYYDREKQHAGSLWIRKCA